MSTPALTPALALARLGELSTDVRAAAVLDGRGRLAAASPEGDAARAEAEHRELVSVIDKAVKRGALHGNNGARKKSRAARMRGQSL